MYSETKNKRSHMTGSSADSC